MATWYPGAMSYRQWRQAESYKEDISNAFKQQTNQIVASQNQARQAVSARLDRIAEINSAGFQNVTNAIESFHSDFNYNMGLLLQEMEIQSRILATILYTLKNPLKTQVEEFYNDGCRLVRESILDKAIQKFSKALELDDTNFLSHYQLGLLFLNGKSEDENVIDLKKANELLLVACRLGKGKAKTDDNFKPVIANTMFFTSLSYYFQTTENESQNLDNAIKYAEESLQYNPNLSQSYYHLGKYYALKGQPEKMKSNVRRAIEIDRNYALEVDEEKAFNNNRNAINELLQEMRDQKAIEAKRALESAKESFSSLAKFEINDTVYEDNYYDVKNQLDNSMSNYNSKTFFGYIDSISLSNVSLSKSDSLFDELQNYTRTLNSLKSKGVLQSIWMGIAGPFMGGLYGLGAGLIIGIPGCIVVAIKDNSKAGENFLNWTVPICILIGVIVGLVGGVAAGQDEYQTFRKSKRKK